MTPVTHYPATQSHNYPKEQARKEVNTYEWKEKHKEWVKFYDRQVAFLKELDKKDSHKGDGRVDSELFEQHYGKFGWQSACTFDLQEPDGGGCGRAVNTKSVNIFEQAEALAKQKFGYGRYE